MVQAIVRMLVMVVSAASVAALVTLFTVAGNEVAAGPLPAPQVAAVRACAERPWPYNTCAGTVFGKRAIRLVTTDRLAAQ